MHKRKVLTSVLMLCAGLAVSTSAAQAASVTTYNASLGSPGFFNGTGGVDTGFTLVSDDSGVKIGLREMLRLNPASQSNGVNNIYVAPLGSQTIATTGGNGPNDPTKAAWNVDYSVDLRDAQLTLGQISAMLTITGGAGSPLTFNVLTAYSDNAGWNGVEHNPALSSDTIVQNSQNAAWLGIPFNVSGTYTFTLDVYRGANLTPQTLGDAQLLATDTIVVTNDGTPAAVPVPAAAWTGMSMLAGMGGIATFRRRRAKLT